METTDYQKEPGLLEKNRTLIKGFLIGFLILLMLIPAAFVANLVSERQLRQQEVVKEVSSKWASGQTVTGPMLVVPYKIYAQQDGKQVESRARLIILPETLSINGKVVPEVRHRSLYTVTLYKSDMHLAGTFGFQQLEKLHIPPADILWNECKLVTGINDARGLEEEVLLKWDTTTKAMEAGVPQNNIVSDGLSADVAVDVTKTIPFAINIKLKGSSELYFTPVGKTTEVNLQSTWKNPAFDGQYLPDKQANIDNNGFNAHWKIFQVSRSYPQCWVDDTKHNVPESAFGVKLIQLADGYAKTERSVKYALLFIALTFIVFFFLEILQKKQIHPLQYLLVGFALCIFYTLLLSISEYTGFNPAYLVASVATVSLIGAYVWGIFKTARVALGFIVSLAALYSYIFILIQLEDYALLFGSIGLFLILAVIMYYSRKIDWYGTGKTLNR
ncbi:MAG: cell envelope integrity protein CreD [Bacteroidetes bacterium]|nr:cell envelope integrity protein CreD [Bacteroidota bacterium]